MKKPSQKRRLRRVRARWAARKRASHFGVIDGLNRNRPTFVMTAGDAP